MNFLNIKDFDHGDLHILLQAGLFIEMSVETKHL